MNNDDIDVLFVGGLASENQISAFQTNSRKGYQFAAQNLEESIIRGVLENGASLNVLSIPGVSTFPFGYKKMIIPPTDFILNGKKYGKALGFVNLPFLNAPSRHTVDKYVDDWYADAKGKKAILVYSLNRYFVNFAVRLKQRYKDIVIIAIVPDLPRYMGCNKFYKLFGFQSRDISYIYQHVHIFDGFVVLTKDMIKDLKMEKKPNTVMEGIFSGTISSISNNRKKEQIVLYTGNINRKYGINELLNAFEYVEDENIKLWIRGDGEMKCDIIKKMESDKRIKYIGPLSREELVKIEAEASLLINPVSPRNEFTHYFFPSKTMNYLSTGKPVLMYKLPCLPEEYEKYLFFIEGEGPSNIASSILSVLGKDNNELIKKGETAQHFIMKEKCAKVQCGKIMSLIDLVYENMNDYSYS